MENIVSYIVAVVIFILCAIGAAIVLGYPNPRIRKKYAVDVLVADGFFSFGYWMQTIAQTHGGFAPMVLEKSAYAMGATLGVMVVLNFYKHQSPEIKKKGAIDATNVAGHSGY